MGKDREATQQSLLNAVDELITEKGFEALGVNAVAARAGVSKMLIYRYFDSLDGLIAAYIRQYDFWINFDQELPDEKHLADFIKGMFRKQISLLRENYTLKRLYRWELISDNAFVKELRDRREAKGLWIVNAVSRLSRHPEKQVAAVATLVNAAISYLVLLEESNVIYNGIHLNDESGWKQLEEGIDLLVDLWLSKK
ncbi:MAG: helix-turn-helix domain containing protein [Bacteroidales bacterium]|nr:helix-turn-helix domain containing protein [Bacteroidales bacterium]